VSVAVGRETWIGRAIKRPREYRFVESLPKSPSGKILRRLIREGAPTT